MTIMDKSGHLKTITDNNGQLQTSVWRITLTAPTLSILTLILYDRLFNFVRISINKCKRLVIKKIIKIFLLRKVR